MPSCSRIARRCGEREASRSGVAGGASATLYRCVSVLLGRFGVSLWVRRPTGGTSVGLFAASPSRRLTRDPELLVRPPLRPFGGDPLVVLVRHGIIGRIQLD